MLKRVHSLEFKASTPVSIVCESGWKQELESQRTETYLIKKVTSEMVILQTDCGGLKRLQDINIQD